MNLTCTYRPMGAVLGSASNSLRFEAKTGSAVAVLPIATHKSRSRVGRTGTESPCCRGLGPTSGEFGGGLKRLGRCGRILEPGLLEWLAFATQMWQNCGRITDNAAMQPFAKPPQRLGRHRDRWASGPMSRGSSTLTGLKRLQQGAAVPVAQCRIEFAASSEIQLPVVCDEARRPPAWTHGPLSPPLMAE